jgi:hypothetical protein
MGCRPVTVVLPTVDARTVDDDGRGVTERRAAAREAYLSSVEAGTPLTGAELGRRFGRTDRWGRLEISRFRGELEAASSNGHQQGSGGRSLPGTRQDSANPQHNGSSAPARRKPNGHPHDSTTEASQTVPEDAVGKPAELASQPHTQYRPEVTSAEPSRSWLDSLITLVLALVCAAASFGHMYHVALLAGEPVWIARAWPITVDGLVLAALRRGQEGRSWLALGIAVSMVANVLAQFPELAASAGPFVSAWPPVALYGTHRLLHGARRPTGGSAVG